MGKKDGPDFSAMKIYPTEKTKIMIEVLNYRLFDDFYYLNIKAKERAEE